MYPNKYPQSTAQSALDEAITNLSFFIELHGYKVDQEMSAAIGRLAILTGKIMAVANSTDTGVNVSPENIIHQNGCEL